MKENLAIQMQDASFKAFCYMIKNPTGEIKEKLQKINNLPDKDIVSQWNKEFKKVFFKRFPVFLEEMKPLIEMPVFNNHLAGQMVNAECSLMAIETVKKIAG